MREHSTGYQIAKSLEPHDVIVDIWFTELIDNRIEYQREAIKWIMESQENISCIISIR